MVDTTLSREIPEALRKGICAALRCGRYTSAVRIARGALRAIGGPTMAAPSLVETIARENFPTA